MFRKKAAFLSLFFITTHDFRQTKAVDNQAVNNETIDAKKTIITFATILLSIAGLKTILEKTLSFCMSYSLHRNSTTLDPYLKEKACQKLDKCYRKKTLFLCIKGEKNMVDREINLFMRYLKYNKPYISYKKPKNKLNFKDICNLVKTPLTTIDVDLVLHPIYDNNTDRLSIAIKGPKYVLKEFQKKYYAKVYDFLDNPAQLEPLKMLLDNYKKHDIFFTNPTQRTFKVICTNQNCHDKNFMKYLKRYVTSYLVAKPGCSSKNLLRINAASLESTILNNFPNSIFFIVDDASPLKIHTIAYKSSKAPDAGDFI